jgi:hypothetical protein
MKGTAAVIFGCLALSSCTLFSLHNRFKPKSFLESKGLVGNVSVCTSYVVRGDSLSSDTTEWQSKEVLVFNRQGKIEKVYEYNKVPVPDGPAIPYRNLAALHNTITFDKEEERAYEYYTDGNLKKSYQKHYNINGDSITDVYEWTDTRWLVMQIIKKGHGSVAFYDYVDGKPQRKGIASYTRNRSVKTSTYLNDSLVVKQLSNFDRYGNLLNYSRYENGLKQQTQYNYDSRHNLVSEVEHKQQFETRELIKTTVKTINHSYFNYDKAGNWTKKVSGTQSRRGAWLNLRFIEYYP